MIKKTIILFVLNILKSLSSKDFPVTQTMICDYINDMDIPCDRKTVGRNIKYLQKFGYPIIETGKRGYYLDKAQMESGKLSWLII